MTIAVFGAAGAGLAGNARRELEARDSLTTALNSWGDTEEAQCIAAALPPGQGSAACSRLQSPGTSTPRLLSKEQKGEGRQAFPSVLAQEGKERSMVLYAEVPGQLLAPRRTTGRILASISGPQNRDGPPRMRM